MPQELFSNELYKDNLNSDSKILYGFLLDRLTLSQKHNWVDKNGNIYLIFTREEVKNKLGLCEKTVIKAFKQFSAVNLILEKRQGQGKPNLIYVGKIKHEPVEKFIEEENMQLQNCTNYSSTIVDNAVLKLNNLQGINTNNINTDIINTYSKILIIIYIDLQYIVEKEMYFKGGTDAYFYFDKLGIIKNK